MALNETVKQSFNSLSALVIRSVSHSSSSRSRGTGPQAFVRDGACCVTSFTNNTVGAHIVARSYAEALGVDRNQVDQPCNIITLARELEQAYDAFHWCFDEFGTIYILFRFTPVGFLLTGSRVALVPEAEGGPSSRMIRIAFQFAVQSAQSRCPDCWIVRTKHFS